MATPDTMLEVRGLTSGYDGRPVVFDLAMTVGTGEIVTVLGSNGAGKTTLLKTIVGLIRPLGGSILLHGTQWDTGRPHQAVRAGLAMIPAEQFVFPGLTVAENLSLGERLLRSPDERDARRDYVLGLFPRLRERLDQRAETMSGGEQRMLSLAAALIGKPRVLLLDEPSLGLAPAVAEQLMATLTGLVADEQLSVLMVEQNVRQALAIADRVYVIRSGRIILDDTAAAVRDRTDWWSLY